MSNAASITLAGSRFRLYKDKFAKYGITTGGIMVLVALLLIFFYLLYVVLPVFKSVKLEQLGSFNLPGQGATLAMGMEEQNEIGYRLTDTGELVFFTINAHNGDASLRGQVIKQVSIPTGDVSVAALAKTVPHTGLYAVATEAGGALIVKPDFKVSFPDDKRVITPLVSYPFGDEPLVLDPQGRGIQTLAFEKGEESAALIALTDDQRVRLTRLIAEEDFLTEEVVWTPEEYELAINAKDIRQLVMTPDQKWLFVRRSKGVDIYDIREPDSVSERYQTLDFGGESPLSDMKLLSGAASLLIAQESGTVSQWFMVAKDGSRSFTRIRDFHSESGITHITPEFFRKGFLTFNPQGHVEVFHTTGNAHLADKVLGHAITGLAISPRADVLLLEDEQGMRLVDLHNPHPEVTWSALWQEVWYEGYPEPDYIWQSTSASDDFEPKMSLVPVAFGTVKAAFYAMLFAVPIALAGAVYTAYFMSPSMRGYVKPTVEIMEAVPTVILGFLAGLWLAPIVEEHLPGIFLMIVIFPVGFILAAWLVHKLPKRINNCIPDGLQAALLIPVVLFLGWLSFALSPLIEQWFMGGDARAFITNELGIGFDQRNSLVVGVAMGFAVIPTIFSIAEDAVFNVPKHLTNGSLALGATPWQTLTRVVLLTASPAIFSAVMMGLGRAVGETMIVLMATGNTPLMDMSIFQGMRTLSANIAVEMPESEVGSSHYRVLFLSAFVLFILTFVFNTVSEFIRQRLREKYSSL